MICDEDLLFWNEFLNEKKNDKEIESCFLFFLNKYKEIKSDEFFFKFFTSSILTSKNQQLEKNYVIALNIFFKNNNNKEIFFNKETFFRWGNEFGLFDKLQEVGNVFYKNLPFVLNINNFFDLYEQSQLHKFNRYRLTKALVRKAEGDLSLIDYILNKISSTSEEKKEFLIEQFLLSGNIEIVNVFFDSFWDSFSVGRKKEVVKKMFKLKNFQYEKFKDVFFEMVSDNIHNFQTKDLSRSLSFEYFNYLLNALNFVFENKKSEKVELFVLNFFHETLKFRREDSILVLSPLNDFPKLVSVDVLLLVFYNTLNVVKKQKREKIIDFVVDLADKNNLLNDFINVLSTMGDEYKTKNNIVLKLNKHKEEIVKLQFDIMNKAFKMPSNNKKIKV